MDSALGGATEMFFLVGILVVGLALGVAMARWFSRHNAARIRLLEAELEAARREDAAYRNEVGSHFSRTSELLRNLTLQYRAIYDHLAEGAQQLAPEGSQLIAGGSPEALLPGSGEVVEASSEAEPAAATAADPPPSEPPQEEAPLEQVTPRVDVEGPQRKSVLFLCTGNSCRSQMAEAFARRQVLPGVEVYSAGIKPVGLNPGAIAAMAEANIDIRSQHSKDISEIPLEEIDLVVTLCGEAKERCPVFPPTVERIHWPIRDPAQAEGSEEEVAQIFRDVRDEVEIRTQALFERRELFATTG